MLKKGTSISRLGRSFAFWRVQFRSFVGIGVVEFNARARFSRRVSACDIMLGL